jgi:hypothetical protein
MLLLGDEGRARPVGAIVLCNCHRQQVRREVPFRRSPNIEVP